MPPDIGVPEITTGPSKVALEGPIHPHPLSNDMTTDRLPARPPVEAEGEREGVGAAPKSVAKMTTIIIAVFAAAALIACAIIFSERRELMVVGAGVFMLYLVFIGAPILLAAGTKVAQDEAVRDTKTERAEARRGGWRRRA